MTAALQSAGIVAVDVVGVDGQAQAQGCGTMVDWVATPHVVGVRNALLFIVTDDPAALEAVRAAASHLGD